MPSLSAAPILVLLSLANVWSVRDVVRACNGTEPATWTLNYHLDYVKERRENSDKRFGNAIAQIVEPLNDRIIGRLRLFARIHSLGRKL